MTPRFLYLAHLLSSILSAHQAALVPAFHKVAQRMRIQSKHEEPHDMQKGDRTATCPNLFLYGRTEHGLQHFIEPFYEVVGLWVIWA